MKEVNVRSAVIHWPEQELVITDTTGNKHTLSLEATITVTMVGYPERETKTMQAHALDPYMSGGYVIEKVCFEE